jgi:hypothetical protein
MAQLLHGFEKTSFEAALRADARRRSAFIALVSSALLGCHHEPTYNDDVAPLVAERCLHCHSRGGIALAPFLESFEQVAAAAVDIRRSTQMRDMPPWGAENSGLCESWHNAQWLRDDEMRLLERWTQNPLPGEPSRARRGAPKQEPAFRPSGIVLDTGGDYRPGLGTAGSRCFVVGPADARDRTAVAFRISSTEPRSVQHATLYAIDSAEGEAAAATLEREDAELGYACYGSSRIPGARLLTSWTWNSSVAELPPGVGVRLPGGHKLVVQIHYTVIATGLDVATHTRIEPSIDDGARIARYLTVAPTDIDLPAHQTRVEVRTERVVPRALRVLGVVPYMHVLGQAMQLDRRTDSFHCMGSFDHWSFYRQRLFSYETPIELPAGSGLRLSCTYGTLGRTEPTRMGEGIDDEECRAELLVVDR